MMSMMQLSPMEQFEIYTLFSGGFAISSATGYLQLAAQICIQIAELATSPMMASTARQIPSAQAILHESLFSTILLMVDGFIGRSRQVYLPQIYTIFYLICFANLQGMVPYSSTPTAEVVMTQSLSFSLLIGVQIQGFLSHKLYLQAAFLPSGTPLAQIPPMILQEVQAYVTRTLSLGLRQAVNMITGHILVKVAISFIWVAYLNGTSLLFLALPLSLLTLFQAQEQQIAYLQAYIFTFIQCITFKDIALGPIYRNLEKGAVGS